MHPLEDAIAGLCCVALWEVARWGWLEVQSRRAMYSHSTAFWAVVSRRFVEADEIDYCPGAECYEDEGIN
jgi:hypothetical protein